MTKTFFKLLFIFITSIPMFAQGGSNYSIFGIGDVIYGNGAAYQAMGGSQIAVPSINNINLLNPAMLSFVTTTRLQTGYRFNQNVVQNDDNELWQNNGGLNGFASVFSFDTSAKISAALYMQPFSTVNYLISTPIEIVANDTVIAQGKSMYQGDGGLSELTIACGSKVVDWLYVGASFASVFGKIEQRSQTLLVDYNALQYELRNSNTFESYSYKLGLYATPINNLGIGLFYEYIRRANVDHKKEYVYEYSGGDTDGQYIETGIVKSFEKQEMPNYFGIGMSYVSGKFMFAGDYLLGTFSDMTVNSAQNVSFRNNQRLSVGVNRMGNPNPFASLGDKIAYKFGGYYEQLYYKIDGQNMDEMAFTLGAQYPLSRNSQIDFAFAIGKRGTTSNGLVNEWFGRFIIDISIGDTWFNPTRKY